MNQDSLVRAAQGGDRQAFEQLLGQCYDQVYRFALKWSGAVADAEDISQLACIKLGRSIGQFRFESAFSTWLYRLVVNCARDWQRSQQRHEHQPIAETSGDDPWPNPASADGEAEAAIYLEQILARVDSIGQGFRETLVLVFGEGLSHRQAAEVLGVRESTVSWRIHEIRKKLDLLRRAEGGV